MINDQITGDMPEYPKQIHLNIYMYTWGFLFIYFKINHALKTHSLIQPLQSSSCQEAKLLPFLFKYIYIHIPEKE